MKVVAFVGPSGTGKSHRAIGIAHKNNCDAIIDDGLLIKGTKILAGTSAKNETKAKKSHREWRERLYYLRKSKKLKGQIIMHKLYRSQLISDLHSTWDLSLIHISEPTRP